jgi:galactitol-specific phosphotransferase system IIB component
MAKMKIEEERRKRELEKVVMESEEIKELKAKIQAANLNKERSGQIFES